MERHAVRYARRVLQAGAQGRYAHRFLQAGAQGRHARRHAHGHARARGCTRRIIGYELVSGQGVGLARHISGARGLGVAVGAGREVACPSCCLQSPSLLADLTAGPANPSRVRF